MRWLFSFFGVLWGFPDIWDIFFSNRYCVFGNNEEESAIWKVTRLAVLLCIQLERNAKTFKQQFQPMFFVQDRITFVTLFGLMAHGLFDFISMQLFVV